MLVVSNINNICFDITHIIRPISVSDKYDFVSVLPEHLNLLASYVANVSHNQRQCYTVF